MGNFSPTGKQMAYFEKVASSKSRASPEKPKSSPPSSGHSLDTAAEQFEYYDAGNHWCKNCNVTSGSMFDYFMHLHSKTHRKTLDPYDRPWAKSESEKKPPAGKRTSKPAKGSEFLIPVRGFFCQLCEEFFGDPICAEAHVTCHAHNEKYKAKMYENPLYEQRRNLDRQAGLESQKSSDHKRKREDDEQDDMKKSKHKKGKMSNNKVETKPQYSKEEAYKNIKESENKLKEKYKKEDMDKQKYKEDDERVEIKKEEDERPRYKKDDDERNRFRKEEEYTYRYKKEEGERSRYEEDRFRNRDDDDEHYRYREEDDRYRFRKEDDKGRYSREEEKPKYGREDDKKYKYTQEVEEKKSKYKDEDWGKWPKSKWDEDQDSNGKYEKKEDKTPHQKGKAGYSKDDKESTGKLIAKNGKSESEKPSEPPKIFCGPSPALLAKLRKKNEEATARPGFGKFGLKKTQKTALEKEAERMAAQFLKEDEEGMPSEMAENKDAELDPFSKSIAAAKSIAIKLTGKALLPPSGPWLAYNESKTNPNLPPPSSPMVIRKSYTAVQNKPTPFANKSPAPIIGAQKSPTLSADLISKAFSGEEVQLKQTKDTPANPVDIFSISEPVPSPTAAPKMVNSSQMKPVTPSQSVFTLKSDVAAPGVPEEEQNLTVILRPPPQLSSNARDPPPKTVKPKTTLAAGKAQDLFDIFYSGSAAAKTSIGGSVGDKYISGLAPQDIGSTCRASSNKDKNVSDVSQSKEPLKDDDSKVPMREEPFKNAELGVAQKELPKNEDSTVTLREKPLKNEESVVAQKESPKNEVSSPAQREDFPKNEDSEVVQTEKIPTNEESNIAQREEFPKNKDLDFEKAFEDAILKPDLPNEDNAKEEHFDDQQALKSIEISVGDITVMEVNSQDTMHTNNEEENPLESEEPMSFSPLPGSFTEQLNLDTFEFNFETL